MIEILNACQYLPKNPDCAAVVATLENDQDRSAWNSLESVDAAIEA
jgi:hypothetical protein